MATESVERMWSAFCAARPEMACPQAAYTSWHFCDNQPSADELADLVLAGTKRATAGALWAYELEGEPVPKAGDFSVITDWSGEARCVIRTTAVEVVPLGRVTAEFAATEGEGDGSLAYWMAVHREAFARELEPHGLAVSDDMPVVCERFEVVFR